MRLQVTLNLPAVAAALTGLAGTVMILFGARGAPSTTFVLVWVGFALMHLGSAAFLEFRMERLAREILRAQCDESDLLAAYERGRLRGV